MFERAHVFVRRKNVVLTPRLENMRLGSCSFCLYSVLQSGWVLAGTCSPKVALEGSLVKPLIDGETCTRKDLRPFTDAEMLRAKSGADFF